MSERPGAPNILIVDDDIGLLWWLGELFNEAGYQSIPALSCEQALSHTKKNRGGVDLLIVDPRLSEVSRLIQTLSRTGSPKIVFIQGPGAVAIPGVTPVATLERPSGWAPVSRTEWRQMLQRILSRIGIRAAS